MRSLILIAASTLALAACGQKSTTTVATDGNGTTTTNTTTSGIPTADTLKLQPGEWETTIAITELKMTGLPAGMTPPKPEPTTVKTCLTPEQASKGPGDFLKQAGADCTATTSNYGGGKIDVAMTCKMPQGTLTTHSTGTYSPTEMTADAEASLTGQMSMTQKVHTTARRLGECT